MGSTPGDAEAVGTFSFPETCRMGGWRARLPCAQTLLEPELRARAARARPCWRADVSGPGPLFTQVGAGRSPKPASCPAGQVHAEDAGVRLCAFDVRPERELSGLRGLLPPRRPGSHFHVCRVEREVGR